MRENWQHDNNYEHSMILRNGLSYSKEAVLTMETRLLSDVVLLIRLTLSSFQKRINHPPSAAGCISQLQKKGICP